jgi:hypothetical protein
VGAAAYATSSGAPLRQSLLGATSVEAHRTCAAGDERQDRAAFSLAYIAPDFSFGKHEMFDTAYMQGLFDYGYRVALDGTVWGKAPPGEGEPVR